MMVCGTLCTMRMTVVDKPGVLVRVALVFSRRGCNLAALVVSPGPSPGFSNMDLSFHGREESLPGIKAQLEKLVDVIEVETSPVGR